MDAPDIDRDRESTEWPYPVRVSGVDFIVFCNDGEFRIDRHARGTYEWREGGHPNIDDERVIARAEERHRRRMRRMKHGDQDNL